MKFWDSTADARNVFDAPKPSVLRLNQFGGSIGGPIVRNKLFFFAGIEALKQRTAHALRSKHSQCCCTFCTRLRSR